MVWTTPTGTDIEIVEYGSGVKIVWLETTTASNIFPNLGDATIQLTKPKTNRCDTNVCQHCRQIEPECDNDIRKANRESQKAADCALVTGLNVNKGHQRPILPPWVDSLPQTFICVMVTGSEQLLRTPYTKWMNLVAWVKIVELETATASFLLLLLIDAISQLINLKTSRSTPISVNIVVGLSLSVTTTREKRTVSVKKLLLLTGFNVNNDYHSDPSNLPVFLSQIFAPDFHLYDGKMI